MEGEVYPKALTLPVDNLLLERELVQVCTPEVKEAGVLAIRLEVGSETKAHKSCRQTQNSCRAK